MVDDLSIKTIWPILAANVSRDAILMTDEAKFYIAPGKEFAHYASVNHALDEYVRAGNPTITTNTVEGYFGNFKRGMKGIYQHCGKQHLHRYVAEFDFR